MVAKELVNVGKLIQESNIEKTFLGASYDALIPALISSIIAILIFAFGVHCQIRINKKEEKTRRDNIETEKQLQKEELKNYFNDRIISLVGDMKLLKTGYEKHMNGQAPDVGYAITPPTSFCPDIELISILNKQDLFKAFAGQNEKKKLANKLYAIEVLKGTISIAEKFQTISHQKSREYLKKYDEINLEFIPSLFYPALFTDSSYFVDINPLIDLVRFPIKEIEFNKYINDVENLLNKIKVLSNTKPYSEMISHTMEIGNRFIHILQRMDELSLDFKAQYAIFIKGIDNAIIKLEE
ncbi:MAG: hypothetical protein ACPG4Y_08330 [Chitinophagales bacterium]